MTHAINLAKKAGELGEIPVGAVIVYDGEIIGEGFNTRENDGVATGHAEIMAITQACNKIGAWRLTDCDIYVTLEPCPMCAGAIINARLKHVFFGAYDEKSGCFGSKINLAECGFNHKPFIKSQVLHDECLALLTEFFKDLR